MQLNGETTNPGVLFRYGHHFQPRSRFFGATLVLPFIQGENRILVVLDANFHTRASHIPFSAQEHPSPEI
jgi:hypothetical protein